MSTILILAEPVSLDRIRAWAEATGLVGSMDPPLTVKRRTASFVGPAGVVSWMSRAGSKHALLLADGPDVPSILDAARSTFAFVELDALLAALAAAEGPIPRLRAAFDLGVFCELVPREERARVIEALAPLLLDEDRALRYAAANLLVDVVDRRLAELLAAAAERHPDLAPTHALVRRACEAEEDGTLYDGPTDSWWELEQRARAGAEAGQWKRVIKASEALLAEDVDHVQGLYYRGLAFEAEGDVPMALAHLGASRAALAVDLRVHDESEREAEGDEKAEERAQLTAIDARIEALRGKDIPTDRWDLSREPLVTTLAKWWEDPRGSAAGAARALGGLSGDLDPLFAFLCGSYEGDRAELARALSLAPDSITVELRLAGEIARTDPAASVDAYERVLGRLRGGDVGPASPAAALIARVDKAPVTLAGVLEELAHAAYKKGDRLRAIALADELVQVEPTSIQGWQLRGHARLFELRYAEAAEAYADAIREIPKIRAEGEASGSIYFGKDPLPAMHYNRCCAFGRLGMKDETLDELRLAVRGDAKYAEEAKTEEWIECVWGTPELEAITRLDPRALATQEELEAPFIERLIERSKGQFYRGEQQAALEAGERAKDLAAWRGDPALEAEALSALAYALAFSGQAGRAVELCARAVVIGEAAPPRKLAEIVSTQAQALHAHGDLEGAERAHRRALDLRRDAHGPDAPVLAKSYGELGRLFSDQGRPAAEVRDMDERGIDVLARFLDAHEAHDDAWAEAITDRATLEVNLAQTLAAEKSWDASARALEVAATTFERAAEGVRLNPRVLENAQALAERLAGACDEEGDLARRIADRFEALRYPGSPAERRERAFFGRLRGFIGRMRREGAPDEALARALQAAAKGAHLLPEELRAVPELRSFAGEIADRSARWPTFLVMSAMALDLAATDLDGSITNLEELAVGYALGGEPRP